MTPERLARLALVIVLAAFLAQCWGFRHYVNDDAYITFRYSRFLATGVGPYFNPGEHVEGYTNFLLMVGLAPVISGFGPEAAPLVARGLGVLCGVGALAVAFLLARGLPKDPRAGLVAGVAAAAVVAAEPAFALNAVSGLETIPFSLLLSLGALLGVAELRRGRWLGAGLAFAMAALTRPEGAFLFGVFWLAAMAATAGLVHGPRVRRIFAVDAVVVGTAVLGQLAFRLVVYDGEWLPNTYWAKIGGHETLDAWSYIRQGLFPPFLGSLGLGAGVLGAALLLRQRALVPLGAIALAGALLPLITGSDWMLGSRLIMPSFPLIAAVIASGWTALAFAAFRERPRVAMSLVTVTVLVLAVANTSRRAYLEERTWIRSVGYETGHQALAGWLCEGRAQPGEQIALKDIGIVGYRCFGQRILDVTGLTDRTIAKSEGTFLRKSYDVAYVLDQRPRFVVLAFIQHLHGRSPYRRPPDGTSFALGSPVEKRIFEDSRFHRLYVGGPRDSYDESWLGEFAEQVGAVRVFPHAHPEHYYLLAVFERSEGS